MRAAWLAVAALVIAIAIQLSLLNGLRLPGGGVPDLVLVLVTALAVAEGPVAGMVFGFGAGLCLDVAPPGSPVVGLYTLVFCLAGWAAGRLSPVSGHSDRSSSGLVSVGLLAVVVAAAEALAAALSLMLAPASVTLAQVRVVLPATIGYDLILCPFVLYLVVLGSSLVADRTGGTRRFQGVVVLGWNASRGWQAASVAPSAEARRHSRRRQRRPDMRLHRAAARRGDGWVKANRVEASAHRAAGHVRHGTRLRPDRGVAGSASGLIRPRHRPAPAVQVRFGTGRRRDGRIGIAAGTAAGRRRASRHPGALAGRMATFRPHAGAPAGTAVRAPRLRPSAAVAAGPARVRFTGHRGDRTLGRAPQASPIGARAGAHRPARIKFGWYRRDRTIGGPSPGRTAPRRPARIRFGGYRRDATIGHALIAGATGRAFAQRSRVAIWFGGHRGDATLGSTLRPSVPGVDVATLVPQPRGSVLAASRPTGAPRLTVGSIPAQGRWGGGSVPKFGRQPVLLRSARHSDGVVAGGVLGERAALSRSHRPTPRLHLSGGAPGMLGGSGRGPRLGHPPGRTGKQPRFGYGRHSPLSALATGRLGRRVGGRWLVRRRAGRRSGVWLIANKSGGPR